MKRAYLIFFAALLSGCVHSGPAGAKKEAAPAAAADTESRIEISAGLVENNIVKGKTTRKEILALLGTPIAVEKNAQQLPKELLAGIKTALPPVARTKEFWKYRSNPYRSDGSIENRVYSVMIFMDDNDVAVDYLTAVTPIAQP